MARYIGITGPIGAGKSSLAKVLAEAMDAQLLLEQAENNPAVAAFYEAPDMYALKAQTALVLERSRKLAMLAPSDRLTVADFLFEKEEVFSKITLKPFEMEIYRDIYEHSARMVPAPVKVVYLKATAEMLLDRIKQRDRPFERSIDRDYLRRVVEGYEQMMGEYDKAPVLTHAADEVDLNPSGAFISGLVANLREGL